MKSENETKNQSFIRTKFRKSKNKQSCFWLHLLVFLAFTLLNHSPLVVPKFIFLNYPTILFPHASPHSYQL